jgi:DNA modification methylase
LDARRLQKIAISRYPLIITPHLITKAMGTNPAVPMPITFFDRGWLAACQRVLKPDGSIWVSGTAHVIHSRGFAMQQLGFRLLNDISWVKPNPPAHLSCRHFTYATETIIWAAKNAQSRHTFNYKPMKETNRGKQLKWATCL